MNFVKNKHCNGVLLAPVGSLDVADLPVCNVADPHVGPVVMSFWKPTPQELAELNANGQVILCISGYTHPAVRVAVLP